MDERIAEALKRAGLDIELVSEIKKNLSWSPSETDIIWAIYNYKEEKEGLVAQASAKGGPPAE